VVWATRPKVPTVVTAPPSRDRRAVIRGAGILEVEDAPQRSPGSGELLVAPDAVGICGTDLELLAGTMAYLANGMASYPIVPGHEWTGIVVGVGGGVTSFAEGDRVVGECTVSCGVCARCQRADMYHLCPNRTETGILRRDGALATRLVFPARAAHRVPSHVDARDAALIEPLAVSMRGVRRTGARSGDPLGIVGAGTIGMLCALTARALGIGPVEIVERDEHRRAFARSLGFAASARPSARLPHVVEAAGSPAGAAAAVSMTAEGGVVGLLGLTGADTVPVDLDAVVIRDLTVVGSLGSPSIWPEAIELVASGQVSPSVLVSHEFALEDLASAFAVAGSRAAGVRKVLARPGRPVPATRRRPE
jgi:L-iditol 2-dehydrogenase